MSDHDTPDGILPAFGSHAPTQPTPEAAQPLKVGQEVWVRGQVHILEVNGEECESGTPTQDDYIKVGFTWDLRWLFW